MITGISAVSGSASKRRQHLLARHVGQVQVEQDQVRALLPRQRETAAPSRATLSTDVAGQREDLLDQTHVRRVVLDVEHGDRACEARSCSSSARLRRQRRRAAQPRAPRRPRRCCAAARTRQSCRRPPRWTAQGPAHRLDESARDREPEAGALDPATWRVESLKRREQTVDRLRGDADPSVGDLEAHPGRGLARRAMTTLPPRRLYLTAFETRLSSTCISR